ncbi:MAG: dihydroorotase family protein [Myxococcales bacterium]
MADLTITNADWLGPDGRFHQGTLVVRDGLLRLGEAPDPEAPTLDAQGLRVLPGAIDAHTHLREPGQEHKEGIERGTRAALAGGVTTVLDMPNNLPPIDSEGMLERKRALFREKSKVNWGLHVQAPFAGTALQTASAKVYLAKSSSVPAVRAEQLAGILRTHPRVTVHAEDESRFLPASSFLDQRSHHLQRPREAVASALEALETAYGKTPPHLRPRVVLCHMSTQLEVEFLEHCKALRWDFWGETCPHYWRLTAEDYVREGPRLKVNPPLRSETDRQAILDAIACGTIDFISTDHAPHTLDEKSDEASAPSGIPSIEWYMPLVLQLVEEGHIGWDRFAELTSRNAARCYGIRGRGAITEGMAADLVLVRKGERPGPKAKPITGAGYDPYPGERFEFDVEATVVNGLLQPRGQEVRFE